MSNMSDIINNTPEGKKAVEKAVRQSIADQEAMSDAQPVDECNCKPISDELLYTGNCKIDGSDAFTEITLDSLKKSSHPDAVKIIDLITQAKKDLLAEVRERATLFARKKMYKVVESQGGTESEMEGTEIVEAVPLAAIKEIEEGL